MVNRRELRSGWTQLISPKRPVAKDRNGSSAAKQSAREQRLHIPPSIGDEVDRDLLPNDTIDQPVGLEEYLPVFLVAQRMEFRGLRAAHRRGRKTIGNFENSVQDALGAGGRIMLSYVGDDIFQVAFGVLGEDDLESHQSAVAASARILLATSANGLTRPCEICWFPSASILSKASVS